MPEIRPYRPADRDALYDICVRTADAGDDARGRYSHDNLMGDLFAVPYAVLEPDMAFVVDDGRDRAGAERVWLGMLTVNVRARAFYDRLGFTELPVRNPEPLTYLGRATGANGQRSR
ncbi:hypothetical protein ACIA5C_41060 [Actinoplanes sp. NPDC051343]|uniref:hypothetical protein n=1 Tax=Actinoplanes sp. NPDC051343 TaxID=3363906 RepID=UPI0037B805A0